MLSFRSLGIAAASAAALVAAYEAAAVSLPNGLPLGVVVVGLAFGLLNALGAVGLVLVYRLGRYINFAQSSSGAAGAILTYQLTTNYDWAWILAVATGFAVSIAIGAVSEILFVQRLFTAPRLILTVATIGIAQFAATVGIAFSGLDGAGLSGIAPRLSPPFSAGFRIGLIHFTSSYVLVFAVAPVTLVALGLFLRRSRYGAVVQAAAENADAARLVGVSVRSLSTMTWVLVGALSGIAAILETPLLGSTPSAAGTAPELLLQALAPAMLAGLANLPVAVGAALLLGVVQEALSFSVNQTGVVNLMLFAIVLGALLLRRRGRRTTTEGEERSFAMASAVRPIPRPLVRLRGVRTARLGLYLALLVVASVLILPLTVSTQNLVTAVVIYVIAGLSITVLTGYGGQISFGQWALVGFGALFGGALFVTYRLPFLAGLVATSLAGSALAVVIGLPALRIRGIFMGVTTLAFAVAGDAYLFNLHLFRAAELVTRPTVVGVDLRGQRTYYFFCLAVLVLCMLGLRRLRRSALGREMLAVRDNERAAASYGIRLARTRLSAFAISGFLASLAGYLYLFNEGGLYTGSFPSLTSLLLFSGVVIGGLGSQAGAVVGMVFFKGIQYFLPGWAQFAATSFGLLLVLLFVPGGLSSLLFGVRDWLFRRYTRRRGIRVPSLESARTATAQQQDAALFAVRSSAGGTS